LEDCQRYMKRILGFYASNVKRKMKIYASLGCH